MIVKTDGSFAALVVSLQNEKGDSCDTGASGVSSAAQQQQQDLTLLVSPATGH